MDKSNPIVGVVMGSQTDWPTMQLTTEILEQFKIPYETKIVSAHRTPKMMFEYAENCEKRGIKVIIAGAGGAAHLPGMIASITTLPVLGVPIKSSTLNGVDSLLSIVQMPKGVPVGTLAIGESGATNAGLLAASILSVSNSDLKKLIEGFKEKQKNLILNLEDPKTKR